MGMTGKSKWLLPLALGASLLTPLAAQAVPSFARQTGLACAMCHTVFPQLTPYGREFKLTGYTAVGGAFSDKTQNSRLSEDVMAPLSAMLQVAYTSLKSGANGAGTNAPAEYTDFPQQFSLFYAGRVSDKVGADKLIPRIGQLGQRHLVVPDVKGLGWLGWRD